MGSVVSADVSVTPLRKIAVAGGDVWHGLSEGAPGYAGFGEAYFSWIAATAVKAWKRHLRMTMNLVVPVGRVRFVFAVDGSPDRRIEEVGAERYARLTVPPGIWFGFQGLVAPCSLILNVASIPHDPAEVERRAIDEINFDWTTR